MYINTFKYKPEDVSCVLCTEYVKKLGCTALSCPCLAERMEAGTVGYAEAVAELFPYRPRLTARIMRLAERFPGTMWQDDAHRKRMETLRLLLGCRKERDTPEFFAALYLLTSLPDTASPDTENPYLDTPDTDEPYTEKPALLNKDRRNKEKEIPDESITDTSNPDPIHPPAPLQGAGYDGMGYEEAREIVKENIEYDILVQDPQQDREQLDEVVDLIAETLCSRKKTIVIAGDEYPAEMVKEKLLRITSSHIEYVFDCLKQNTTYVRNIKKYLLASLFNAPSTIGSYYSALVNHDMYGDGLRGR